MIKNIFAIAFMLFLSLSIFAQRKRTLLVGISKYDIPQTAYQWNNINGANDVTLLSHILKSKGFIVNSLINGEATYNNIITHINNLIKTSRKGDIVYFHFSGHGQPVEDRNGDEEDGWDEALIPIDAYKIYQKGIYEGEKHIIDDVFGLLISKLRTAIGPQGFVYVVLDACHAGTASRGDEDAPIRGTSQGFAYTRGKYFIPKKIETANYYKIAKSTSMANAIFFEACRPYQLNREIKVGNIYYGPLSYLLSLSISSVGLTNPSLLINTLNKYIISSGKWPMDQNLVIEKSY